MNEQEQGALEPQEPQQDPSPLAQEGQPPEGGAPEQELPLEREPEDLEEGWEDSGELRLTWQNRPANLLKAAEAVDIIQKAGRRRGFHMGVVALLVVFFLPELRFDSLVNILGGLVLLALAGAAAAMAYWGPARANRKFSQEKAASAPTAEMTLTRWGFSLREGNYSGSVDFAQQTKCAAAELEGVVALSFDKNRVSAIPLGDLTPDQRDQLRELLRQGLGDRFHKLPPRNR